jgi:S-adenosylmethionine/arginine decarboxylase-like enzyme
MPGDNEHAPLRMNEHAPLGILAGSSGGLQGLQGMLREATRSVLGFVAAVSFSAFSPSVVSAVMIMCICIYTYRERERARAREKLSLSHTHTHTHSIVYMYV